MTDANTITGDGMTQLVKLLAELVREGIIFTAVVGECDSAGWAVTLTGGY